MKPIPGFRGYFATEQGVIISTRRGHAITLKPWFDGRYYTATVSDEFGKKSRPVHRLVLLAFQGQPPTSSHVCRHLNGVKTDNRAENLAWGTSSENALDAIHHGTSAAIRQGERHNASKLTDGQAIQIAGRIANGGTNRAIAAAFNVCPKTISNIRRGVHYTNVTAPLLNPKPTTSIAA
ncbi:MAG TPA: HNH endonuclease [Tepidisphaeraceae bacterium]